MSKKPLILWNHRWEYDKNPEEFFEVLFELKAKGYQFEVAVLGQSYSKAPKIFAEAGEKLKDEIVQFGFAESFDEYKRWLQEADILPVTSVHDFFGESVVQAIYCDCYPLLPNRLSYLEHIPINKQNDHIYNSKDELIERLIWCIDNIEEVRKTSTKQYVERYDWSNMKSQYDKAFEELLKG